MADIWFGSKLFYDSVLAVSCGIAIGFGGVTERTGAAIAIAASGATALVLPVSRGMGLHDWYGFALVNLLTLIAFDQLMARSRASWPIWATGFQLASVALDFAMAASPVASRPYLAIQGKLAYPILAAMIAGAVRARALRLRAHAACQPRTNDGP